MNITINRSLDPHWSKLQPHLQKMGKGDRIEGDTIKAICGADMMRMRNRIYNFFMKNLMVPTFKGGACYILTDQEQAGRPDYRIKKSASQLKYGLQEGLGVDQRKCTPEAAEKYEKQMDLMSRIRNAANGANKRITWDSTYRETMNAQRAQRGLMPLHPSDNII